MSEQILWRGQLSDYLKKRTTMDAIMPHSISVICAANNGVLECNAGMHGVLQTSTEYRMLTATKAPATNYETTSYAQLLKITKALAQQHNVC